MEFRLAFSDWEAFLSVFENITPTHLESMFARKSFAVRPGVMSDNLHDGDRGCVSLPFFSPHMDTYGPLRGEIARTEVGMTAVTSGNSL
jgi:hypothetical protein